MVRLFKVFLIFSVLFISTIKISCGQIDKSWYKTSVEYTTNYEIQKLKVSKLSICNLDRYMELLEVSHKDIVLKQIILESGWLKSGLTIKYNNVLGMKLPKTRETTAIGEKLGHAEYKHWTDSIDDYLLWRNYWESKGFDTSDYYKFLYKVGYAEASNYIKTLKKIDTDKERHRLSMT